MEFVLIEEWDDAENPYKFHRVPVFAGTFATKEEADKEAVKREPQHGGIIRAVPAKPEPKPVGRPRGSGRRKHPSRDTRRR